MSNIKEVLSEKATTVKAKAKEFGSNTYEFCQKHKEALIVFVPVMVSGTIELIKIAARSRNTKEDKYLKENYVYDRSSGHYYELKRQPKSSEWRLIDQRKAEGELLGDILNDMRILK